MFKEFFRRQAWVLALAVTAIGMPFLVAAEEVAPGAAPAHEVATGRHLVLRGFAAKAQAERAVSVLRDALAAQWTYQRGGDAATPIFHYDVREDIDRGGYLIDVLFQVPETGEMAERSERVAGTNAGAQPEAQFGYQDFAEEEQAVAVADALRKEGKGVEVKQVRIMVPDRIPLQQRFARRTDAQRALGVLKEVWAEQWNYAAPDLSGEERQSLERLANLSVQEDREQGGYRLTAHRVSVKSIYRVGWRAVVTEQPAPAEEPPVLVAVVPGAEPEGKSSPFRLSGKLRGELGWPIGHGLDGGVNYANGSLAVGWQPASWLDFHMEGRVDGYWQGGGSQSSDVKLRPGELYVRWRGESSRLTVGSQKVLWGTLDEVPLNDRLSRIDARRGLMDDLADRRLAVPMVRLERYFGGLKLDALVEPRFVPAQLPELNSYWSPVDMSQGGLLGLPSNPLTEMMVRGGTFGDERGGWGGAGVRLSQAGEGLDWALTAQRFRPSTPYYQLDENVRSTLLATGNPAMAVSSARGDVFTGRHPLGWAFGGELAKTHGAATLRAEAVYLSDIPVTTRDLRLDTVAGVDWGAGVEWYPGDAEARMVIQLVRHQLLGADAVLDRTTMTRINGAYQDEFGNGRWRVRVRYTFATDQRDFYWNPELAYVAREPHQWYVGAHLFAGSAGSVGGFYRDKDLFVVGWRARY